MTVTVRAKAGSEAKEGCRVGLPQVSEIQEGRAIGREAGLERVRAERDMSRDWKWGKGLQQGGKRGWAGSGEDCLQP